jgi:phage tail protein X
MKHITLICLLVVAVSFVGCKKNDPQATEPELQGLQDQPADTGAYGTGVDTTAGTGGSWSNDTGSGNGTASGAGTGSTYAPSGPRIHTVVQGENIWRISGMYYSKASQANVQKILDANPGIVPTKMPVGTKLVIPD